MQKSYLERRTKDLQRELSEAQKAGDANRLAQLEAEWNRMLSTLK
jgi:uncharacterized membrane protein (DUF106 family)